MLKIDQSTLVLFIYFDESHKLIQDTEHRKLLEIFTGERKWYKLIDDKYKLLKSKVIKKNLTEWNKNLI